MALLDDLEAGFDAAFVAPCPPTAAFDFLYRVTLPTTGEADLPSSDAPAWRYGCVALGLLIMTIS